VTRESAKTSTHRRINRSCLRKMQNRETNIRKRHVTHYSTIKKKGGGGGGIVKDLSGAQDLYITPGCLKLFSLGMTSCINQQIQCDSNTPFSSLTNKCIILLK
jgi:hypothetical protein